jgi:hypothetical protein
MIGSEISPHTFGFKLQAQSTLEEKENLKEAAKMALTNSSDPMKGGLYYNDYIQICSLIDSSTNVKLAQAVFGYMVDKNLKRQAEMQQKNIESQAQSNSQRDDKLFQQKAQLMQMEHQFAMEILDRQAQIDGSVLNGKAQEKFAGNEQKAELQKQVITHKAIVDTKSTS